MNDEISTVVVVSEQSRSQLLRLLECPPATNFVFCTTDEEVDGALYMFGMIPIKEVLIVGPLIKNSIAGFASYARDQGAPVRVWRKETVH